jgi:hypothetical protein
VNALDTDQLGYLASLVRMDIRKRERAVAKFAPRPGQDPAEAAEFLAKMENHLEWKRGVLITLTGGAPS